MTSKVKFTRQLNYDLDLALTNVTLKQGQTFTLNSPVAMF